MFLTFILGFNNAAWALNVVDSVGEKEKQTQVGKPCLDAVRNMDSEGELTEENALEAATSNRFCVEWWKLIKQDSTLHSSNEELDINEEDGTFSFVPKEPEPYRGGIEYEPGESNTEMYNGVVYRYDIEPDTRLLPYDPLPAGATAVTLPDGSRYIVRNVRAIP